MNSEECFLNGEKLIYLAHPISLFNQIKQKLIEVGAEKFFSNPDESTKRARESLPQYFFTLALKKQTGKDWWVLHPSDPSSDFFLMAVDTSSFGVTLEQFELVQVPSHFKTFDEALGVVRKKLTKGYPKHYNLLIFINHERSKEWAAKLHENLPEQCPFKTIGVVYLLFEKGTHNPLMANVHRLRPLPIVNLPTRFDEKELYKPQDVAHLMEEVKAEGKTFIRLKPDIQKEINLHLKKFISEQRKRRELS